MTTQTGESLFAGIPASMPEELENLLVSGRKFRLNRIVSRGHTTPDGEWYDQAEEEWVIVVSGGARLEFEDRKTVTLQPGDHILLPAHCRHRVAWTDPEADTVWLAIYFEL